MKNILITGISGFIGQHLVDFFYKKTGVRIFGSCLDVDEAKAKFAQKVVDISLKTDADFIQKHHIDTIIHLAGIAHDLKNTFQEKDYMDVNYMLTRALYDIFLQSEATRFIFFSSIKAAVDHTETPVDEQVIPSPVTPYGKSKRKAEEHLLSSVSEDKKTYILRPCMIYGPGNKGNLNLLYNFIRKGIPYPLGLYDNRRTFLYIENLLFAIERFMSQNIPSGIYNVSDSESVSTRELIMSISDSLGKKARILNVPRRIIQILARAGSIAGLFFNTHTLNKLTENLEVKNDKLLKAIGTELPFSTREGLIKTLKTF